MLNIKLTRRINPQGQPHATHVVGCELRPVSGNNPLMFNLNERIELLQYSRSSETNCSLTLTELLKWFKEAHDESNSSNTILAWKHAVLVLPRLPCLTRHPFVLSFNILKLSVRIHPKMMVQSPFHQVTQSGD